MKKTQPIIKYWSGLMKKFNVLPVLFLFTLCLSCQYKALNPRLGEEWTPLKKSKRYRIIKKNTKNYQQYRGLDLLFDINVTFLNTTIREDNLKKKSQYMMWSPSEAQDEASKFNLEKVNKSKFFVTMYSINKKLNQLHLKASDWTAAVILSDGSLHKGTIKLHQNLKDHNSVFYPHVESWDKSYMVTFDVPTTKLSEEAFIFDLTSPRGSARFQF